jgi:hypothetical protein
VVVYTRVLNGLHLFRTAEARDYDAFVFLNLISLSFFTCQAKRNVMLCHACQSEGLKNIAILMTTKTAFFRIIAAAGIIIGFVLIQLLPTKAG